MDQTNDLDITESMAAFEAAVSAEHLELPTPELERILVTIDGSNQDATTEDMGLAVARKHQAALRVLYAYEGADDPEREAYLRQRVAALQTTGMAVEAVSHRPNRRSFHQILEAQQAGPCDLIVVDAPYLDSFDELGSASVGANLDLLLHVAPCPVLVIREPEDQPNEEFRTILLPAVFSPACNAKAAAWALRWVHESGTLRVFLIADLESFAQDYIDLDEAALLALEEREQAGLIAAIQRRAARSSLRCRVKARTGDPVTVLRDAINEGDCLTIVGHPGAADVPAHQRLTALIRESRNPVLVV